MSPSSAVLVAVAASAALAFAAGCDMVRLQHGRVVDCPKRQPIDGAMIQLRDNDSPKRVTYSHSDADGTYLIAVPGEGDMHQTVSAPGHRQDERDVRNTREQAEADHEVCLAPARQDAEAGRVAPP